MRGPVVDGRDVCEYAGDGVVGTGEREIGLGDSEGMKNVTCFLGSDLVFLTIADGVSELVGMSSKGQTG